MSEVTQARVLRRSGNPAPVAAPAQPPAPTGPNIWESLSAPATITNLKGVLFGPPKTKKTLHSLSGGGKKLLVLTEPEGDIVLAGRKDVKVLRPKNFRELNQIVEGLHGAEGPKWDRVVFDSITFMFEVVGAKEILKVLAANKDARRQYLNAGASINQIVHDAVALPMDVIFTAQMAIDRPNEEAGETPLNPEDGEYPLTLAITPMVYKILVPAVSFIGRTYKKSGLAKAEGNKPARRVVEYWTSFEDYGKSPAGSRLLIPEQVKDLNMDELLATIKKEA